MDRRLILVEGLPGSGKSTSAQWLKRIIERGGGKAQWCYELDKNHPLSLSDDIEQLSDKVLIKKYLTIWRDFADSTAAAKRTIIIDGGFFQKSIMLMMNRGVQNSIISAYAKEVESVIGFLDPLLIFYQHSNVKGHMTNIYQRRGKSFENALTEWSNSRPFSVKKGYCGLEGSISYWSDYIALCEMIFAACTIEKLKINISQECWRDYQLALCSYLGLDESEDKYSDSQFQSLFAGTYRLIGSDLVVRIKRSAQGLVAENLMRKLETESVLIAVGPNMFEVRGHDVILNFEEMRSSEQWMLTVKSSWSKIDGQVFEKVG